MAPNGDIPGSPKELATALSLAVQAAVSDGKRRLEITLPDGLCFGLFGQPPGQQELGDPMAALTIPTATRQRADRELAFLVLEMFQGLGSENIACVIPDEGSLTIAAREWNKAGFCPRLALSPRQLAPSTAKKGSGGGGFGGGASGGSAKSSAPPKLIVAVRANKAMLKELNAVVKPLGNEVVVVLANPPSQKVAQKGNRAGYDAAFTLLSNPHPQWRGGLLHQEYPGKWALAVAAKVGAPRVHGKSDERPTLEAIDRGFATIKDDTSLVNGGAMAAVGVAAALERVGEKQLTLAGEVAAEAEKAAAESEPQEVLPGADKIRNFFGLD